MLKLPQITLIAMTTKDIEAHYKALEYSSRGIQWGAVKLITSIPCNSIDEWNKNVIFRLREFVDTDYCMLIHSNGFVVNPESWHKEFLDYDFIGAPWPLPSDNYSYRTPDGEIVRVGNSVSIRSRKILNLPAELEFAWRSYFGNTNEDGFLTCHNRRLLQHFGCTFAPLEVAAHFSRETEIPENAEVDKPFAFHNYNGRNNEYINFI